MTWRTLLAALLLTLIGRSAQADWSVPYPARSASQLPKLIVRLTLDETLTPSGAVSPRTDPRISPSSNKSGVVMWIQGFAAAWHARPVAPMIDSTSGGLVAGVRLTYF